MSNTQEQLLPLGSIVRNIPTGNRFRKMAFGWQQIEPDGTVTKFEYPLPCSAMATGFACGTMEVEQTSTQPATGGTK